jgi:hypothetical protein
MTIERILYEAHSGWRYLVILVAILAFAKLLIGLVSRGRWSGLDQGLARALPIVLDIQVLLGLVLWIARRQWSIPLASRTWEHPVTMLIAVAIAHATWSQIRKREDSSDKFRIGVIGYAVSGLVLALGIARITGVVGPIY